jgi:hypothetical protein
MKKLLLLIPILIVMSDLTGCRHPVRKLKNIQLGMTPDEVEEHMGAPYAPRSSKLFEGEETTLVWEYRPPFVSNNDDRIHIIFENDKVVQWGVAGDYSTGDEINVREYKATKKN